MCVGALTLKPSAYTFRPWEVSTVGVADLFDYTPGLTFGVRGPRVVRVGAPTGWVRDRVRFCYDGFRRQRLVRVYHRATQLGWAHGVARWWACLGGSTLVVAAAPGAPGWFHLLAARVGRPGGPPVGCVYDANRVGRVFHGPFGLTASTVATLVVPVGLDYEAAGVVPTPVGAPTGVAPALVQAVAPAGPGWAWSGPAGLGAPTRGGRTTRSVFQVSPLQRLLGDAAD